MPTWAAGSKQSLLAVVSSTPHGLSLATKHAVNTAASPSESRLRYNRREAVQFLAGGFLNNRIPR